LKLVLDELYSQSIAVSLRERGHVISIHERPDLKGLNDEQLFPLLADEHRAIVTENWPDYQQEMRKAADAGRDHYGVLFTSRKQLPRSKQTIGRYVRVLDDFLTRHPADDALLNSYRWLPERGQAEEPRGQRPSSRRTLPAGQISSPASSSSVDELEHLEHRQVHRDHDHADHRADADHQDGLDDRGQ
jgi:hypothetical protein